MQCIDEYFTGATEVPFNLTLGALISTKFGYKCHSDRRTYYMIYVVDVGDHIYHHPMLTCIRSIFWAIVAIFASNRSSFSVVVVFPLVWLQTRVSENRRLGWNCPIVVASCPIGTTDCPHRYWIRSLWKRSGCGGKWGTCTRSFILSKQNQHIIKHTLFFKRDQFGRLRDMSLR